MSTAASAGQTLRRPRVRLTRRAFTDLGLWMLALGVAIGVAFPFVMIPLGVPAELTLRPQFFVATVVAGLALAVTNYLLARSVVGSRVKALAHQMRHVGGVISEATYSGDWDRCSPAQCQLVVDSDDELGDAAASFNGLIDALAASRYVQLAMSDHVRTLSEHLELAEVTQTALRSFMSAAGASAGALYVARDGELEVSAMHRLEGDLDYSDATVRAALDDNEPAWVDVPEGLTVDATLLSFRPVTVAVLPVTFRAVPMGVIVLAFTDTPTPETRRLVDAFRTPTGVALNNALAHERFQHLAAVDPLTGTYNRRFGLGRLAEEWARTVRGGSPLGLIGFDLDHFKAVNDTHGHLAGDKVLRETAAAVRQALREGDVLVRTGGEEFLVLLPGAGFEDVRAVGERIRRMVRATSVQVANASVSLSVSLGGASFPGALVDSPEQLIELVDQAMYAAKDAGRDQLVMSGALVADTMKASVTT